MNKEKWVLFLKNSCVYYTVLTAVLIFLQLISSQSFSQTVIYLSRFLLLYPASACFSGAGMIRHAQRLKEGIRLLIHYSLVMVGFYGLLWLPSYEGTGIHAFIWFLVFNAIYFALFGIVVLWRKKKR